MHWLGGWTDGTPLHLNSKSSSCSFMLSVFFTICSAKPLGIGTTLKLYQALSFAGLGLLFCFESD
jgi:ABC-type uncharacterized transport system permease subunit